MKEQIEEMAKDLCKCLVEEFGGYSQEFVLDAKATAEKLYNAGYRKQSENTVEVVRCEECQESEVCPDTLLWCNEHERLVPPKGFCHCGAKMKGGDKS